MKIDSEKELNRYTIAVHDLEKAIAFLNEAENHPSNSLVYEALLIAALVHYVRPFSSNETSKTAEATSRIEIKSFIGLTSDELALHGKCKDVRNKAVAHAEWNNYPTRFRRDTGVIASRSYSILSDSINWKSLKNLASNLLKQCHHLRAGFVISERL